MGTARAPVAGSGDSLARVDLEGLEVIRWMVHGDTFLSLSSRFVCASPPGQGAGTSARSTKQNGELDFLGDLVKKETCSHSSEPKIGAQKARKVKAHNNPTSQMG